MEPITAYDRLQRVADIADEALKNYHHQGSADRLNSLWEALLQVSNERIEYNNTIGSIRKRCPDCNRVYYGAQCPVCVEIKEAANV